MLEGVRVGAWCGLGCLFLFFFDGVSQRHRGLRFVIDGYFGLLCRLIPFLGARAGQGWNTPCIIPCYMTAE